MPAFAWTDKEWELAREKEGETKWNGNGSTTNEDKI